MEEFWGRIQRGPFGLRKHEMWRSAASLVHVANHCFMSCKHKALKFAAHKRAVPQTQRLIPKGRGSGKQTYIELLHSSCLKFCVVMVVSDSLRSTLIWSTLQNFSGGTHPLTLYNTVCYMHADNHTLHVLHQPPLYINYMYAPTFFNLWICPSSLALTLLSYIIAIR